MRMHHLEYILDCGATARLSRSNVGSQRSSQLVGGRKGISTHKPAIIVCLRQREHIVHLLELISFVPGTAFHSNMLPSTHQRTSSVGSQMSSQLVGTEAQNKHVKEKESSRRKSTCKTSMDTKAYHSTEVSNCGNWIPARGLITVMCAGQRWLAVTHQPTWIARRKVDIGTGAATGLPCLPLPCSGILDQFCCTGISPVERVAHMRGKGVHFFIHIRDSPQKGGEIHNGFVIKGLVLPKEKRGVPTFCGLGCGGLLWRVDGCDVLMGAQCVDGAWCADGAWLMVPVPVD